MNISRARAESILNREWARPGDFLVRPSSHPKSYAISLLGDDAKCLIQHRLILADECGKWYLLTDKKEQKGVFASVMELIEFYQQTGLETKEFGVLKWPARPCDDNTSLIEPSCPICFTLMEEHSVFCETCGYAVGDTAHILADVAAVILEQPAAETIAASTLSPKPAQPGAATSSSLPGEELPSSHCPQAAGPSLAINQSLIPDTSQERCCCPVPAGVANATSFCTTCGRPRGADFGGLAQKAPDGPPPARDCLTVYVDEQKVSKKSAAPQNLDSFRSSSTRDVVSVYVDGLDVDGLCMPTFSLPLQNWPQ